MKSKTRSTILTFFVIVFILFLFNMNGFSKIIANYSEKGFESPGREIIRLHIIEAAGYFLKSYSNFLLLLNNVELSDIERERIDYAQCRQIINDTILQMENARERYGTLKQIADSTPYNQTVISRLLDANDSLLQERDGSKSVISNEVAVYLRSGDVRGIYHQMFSDTRQILDMLSVIKSAVEAEMTPANFDLWKVNRFYSRSMLLGQYIAEIFSKITGQ